MSIDDDTLRSFAEENVARGAQLLDAERPGWHLQVDIARLYLGSCSLCVLGQLFGGESESFYDGIEQLAPSAESNTVSWAVDHGFDTDRDGQFDALTQAWLDAINERRWSARPGALQAVPS